MILQLILFTFHRFSKFDHKLIFDQLHLIMLELFCEFLNFMVKLWLHLLIEVKSELPLQLVNIY